MTATTGSQKKGIFSQNLSSMGDDLDLCSSKIVCLANVDFGLMSMREDAVEGFRNSMDEICWKIDEIASQLHAIEFSKRE